MVKNLLSKIGEGVKSAGRNLKYATAAGIFGLGVLASPSNANADIIYGWRDLMDTSSGWQNVSNYPEMNFKVSGDTPAEQNYDFGGLSFIEDGMKVTAYLQNNDARAGPSRLSGAFDRGELGIGGKPSYWVAVQKIAEYNGKQYLGETDGSGNLTIAPENNVWTSDSGIEFNGELGAVEQIPGCTSDGTLQINTNVDLVPEPTSGLLALTALGGTALMKRKRSA